MGFWNELFSVLGWTAPSTPSQSKPTTTNYQQQPGNTPTPGAVLKGRVDYLNDKFAKVTDGNIKAVVFCGEMASHKIESPTDVLHEGQEVEFVLLKNDVKGWVASISAVTEAKIRLALSKASVGDRVAAKVVELKDSGIVVKSKHFEAWIPNSELSWQGFDHPSEVVSLGDSVSVFLIRIDCPEGWLAEKRARRAKAIGSLRSASPMPESPLVNMGFSGMPFKIWAVEKRPVKCDPVVMFVLDELTAGNNAEDLVEITGLTRNTLDLIHTVLVDEDLAHEWRPTAKGKRLNEAAKLAIELNEDSIQGVFISAAPPTYEFITADTSSKKGSYPKTWPRPLAIKRAEDKFVQATNESLPESLISRIVTGNKRELLNQLLSDDRLRVFMRCTHSRKSLYLDVPEYWLLAGLWKTFESVGMRPFRPGNTYGQCNNFLMVCLEAFTGDENTAISFLFLEPYTNTLWSIKKDLSPKVHKYNEQDFPPLPAIAGGIALPTGELVTRLRPIYWCAIRAN